jgi:hypothetical protein
MNRVRWSRTVEEQRVHGTEGHAWKKRKTNLKFRSDEVRSQLAKVV